MFGTDVHPTFSMFLTYPFLAGDPLPKMQLTDTPEVPRVPKLIRADRRG